MKKIFLLASLFTSIAFAGPEGSPFTDVLYDYEPFVKVQYNGKIYHLISLNGVRRADIMKKCEELFYNQCKSQFAEHFIETMEAIGLKVGTTVKLELYLMDDHKIYAFENVQVTEENLNSVIQNRSFRGDF